MLHIDLTILIEKERKKEREKKIRERSEISVFRVLSGRDFLLPFMQEEEEDDDGTCWLPGLWRRQHGSDAALCPVAPSLSTSHRTENPCARACSQSKTRSLPKPHLHHPHHIAISCKKKKKKRWVTAAEVANESLRHQIGDPRSNLPYTHTHTHTVLTQHTTTTTHTLLHACTHALLHHPTSPQPTTHTHTYLAVPCAFVLRGKP